MGARQKYGKRGGMHENRTATVRKRCRETGPYRHEETLPYGRGSVTLERLHIYVANRSRRIQIL